jgi:biotin transporter BioY
MLFGTAWLVFFFHLAPGVAFALAAAPFLASQCIKIVAAAGIFAAFRHKA